MFFKYLHACRSKACHLVESVCNPLPPHLTPSTLHMNETHVHSSMQNLFHKFFSLVHPALNNRRHRLSAVSNVQNALFVRMSYRIERSELNYDQCEPGLRERI